ncbi:nucleoside-diphosphate-sugar epimerase [Variovorax ginsengisoli]|uniref:Nucleoside-diphosphate-sugar epimerase n=1 Tax=Variovorax ginsengisoli TaxID=363844 RepID=A0ABT9S915_9BURK|nr:nucleoside-diphosphate-sugar epimerase [Variovorax ginsengisoli]
MAGHLVKLLLENNWTVHATVRDPGKAHKLRALVDLQTRFPGRLQLFGADLLREGSFDDAMSGCDTVFHVASPFFLPEQIENPRVELLEPALAGTRNVLGAVNRCASVDKVVLTSTVGAMFGDYADVLEMSGHVLTEDQFNRSSTLENNPYHYSKVVAEQEAWRIVNGQKRWRMVAINPGLVLGPALTPDSDSGSLFLLDELMRGVFFYGVPDFSFATVDVRDVAQAHLAGALNDDAHGRYIVAAREMTRFVEMSRIVRRVHDRPWLLPRHQLPDALVRLIGPLFGLSQSYIRNHLGIRFTLDNQRSIDELGLRYRPIDETLSAHADAWQTWRKAVKA